MSDLSAEDFGRSRIWRVSAADLATPIQYEDLRDDEPDVALTEYELNDGTKMRGFCTIYDSTGHVVFDSQGRPITLTDENNCSPAEASTVAKVLGRTIDQVFPVKYQITVKVFGRFPKGMITIETNRIIVP